LPPCTARINRVIDWLDSTDDAMALPSPRAFLGVIIGTSREKCSAKCDSTEKTRFFRQAASYNLLVFIKQRDNFFLRSAPLEPLGRDLIPAEFTAMTL
jgi:hypothetical protein